MPATIPLKKIQTNGVLYLLSLNVLVLGSSYEVKRTGIIKEAHTINLGFKTAGQIKRILAQEGDHVKKGELLAELDAEDYRLGVEALQIQYNQLKDEVGRTKKLLEQKSISVNDYEKASAGLQQLGVQLQINKHKLNYTRLYAPTDGYIQNVNFSPSEMVDAGTAVFTLLDVSHMEVTVDIPASEYRMRNQFTKFYCKANGIENEIPMILLSCSPKADGNQLYQLHLAFEKHSEKSLTAGVNVEVRIVSTDSISGNGVAIPPCAVFLDADSNKPCVWVFNQDSTVTKRQVMLDGTDAEGRAIVINGLNGMERIVRAGVRTLKDGERVRIVERKSKTNKGDLL